jgi:hypothetical protein
MKTPRKSKKRSAGKASGMSVTVQHPDASSRKTKLPSSLVRVARNNKLEVNVERLNKQLISDQRARMAASDGCISNPGGPSC